MITSINKKALYIFTLLAIIWGSSFILIKKSLGVFDPIQIGSLRIIITFLALSPFAIKYLKKINTKDGLIIGVSALVGNFFPAYLFAFAQQGINSSTAGILNSLTPLFAMLIGLVFFKFQAKWWNYIGIMITLLGTYGLLSISGGQDFGFNLQYGGLILIASFGYGLQVNIIKHFLPHLPSFSIVVIQFFIISIPALFILLFATDFVQIASLEKEFLEGLMYVGILAVIATAFALVLFYRLVKLVDPVFSSSVTYFIPAIATLWGLIDGETIGISYFLWVTVILIGVFIVNTKKRLF
jgi:drug/metabolite transporter (DMT)-like permease